MTSGFTRYTPAGSSDAWTVVAGRNLLVVLAAGAPADVVDGLWRLGSADGVTIEQIVGRIPLAGHQGVASFAALTVPTEAGEDGRTVTVVVRGTASVDVVSPGGARRFTAGAVQPWVLADFRCVTGLVIGDDEWPTAPAVLPPPASLPLADGVVGAGRVYWSEREVATAARAEVDAKVDADPHLDSHLDADDTILRPGRHGGGGGRVPDPEAPALFRFRLAGGEPVDLDAPTYFGRSPRPPGIPSAVAPRLVTVPSPDHEVSATHLRVEQVGSTVVVSDLRSTNGSVVAGPGIPRARLRPGESRVVLPGTTVDIGDGNIIEIVSPGRDT